MLMRELNTRTVKIQNLCADSNKELLNYFQKDRRSEQFLIEGRKQSGIVFVLLFLVMWLVQKTRASFLTNQIQNWSQPDLVTRVFPRFSQFACFSFEFSLVLGDIFLAMLVSCCDFFSFSSRTLIQRELYKCELMLIYSQTMISITFTFVINLSITIKICLSHHFIQFFIC